MEAIQAANNFITIFLNHLTLIPWVRMVVYFFAFTSDMWVGAIGFLYLLFFAHEQGVYQIDRIKKHIAEGAAAAAGVITLWLMSWVIKITTHMPRPYIALSEIVPIAKIPLENFQSFPSGHTTLFFALATAIFIRHKKAGVIFYIFAALIAIGRVMAGVHFAGDILVGIALGVIGILLFNRLMPHFKS